MMGAGTRKELENWGCYADLLPNSPCSESLAKKPCVRMFSTDEAICLFRAEETSDVLIKRLREKSSVWWIHSMYHTEKWGKRTLSREMLEDVDAITFCSASAVSALHK